MVLNIIAQSQPWFLGSPEMCCLIGMRKKEEQALRGPERLLVNKRDATYTAFFGGVCQKLWWGKIIGQRSLTVQRCTAVGRSLTRCIWLEGCEFQACQYLKWRGTTRCSRLSLYRDWFMTKALGATSILLWPHRAREGRGCWWDSL